MIKMRTLSFLRVKMAYMVPSPNIKSENGRMPLDIIVRKLKALINNREGIENFVESFKDIIRKLLKNGANPSNATYKEAQNNPEIINLLNTHNTYTVYEVEAVSLDSITNFFKNLSLNKNNN